MKFAYTTFAVGLCCLLGCGSVVQADSSVWKVTRGDDHLYLAGTIHLLSASDYPLPAAFDQAYLAAEDIVLEANLDDLQTPQFQQALLQELLYPSGQSLRDDLSTEALDAVEVFFGQRGIPMQQVVSMRPPMVAVTITMMELQRLGLADSGVDQFYMDRAKADAKEIIGLETAAEQIAFLSLMGQGQEDEMILHTLRDMEELPKLMADMKDAWRAGRSDDLKAVALDPLMEDYPQLYTSLVVDRNNAWMSRLEGFLETDDVEFVLVGALHLIGENGLLAQLAVRGCQVEKLAIPDQPVPLNSQDPPVLPKEDAALLLAP